MHCPIQPWNQESVSRFFPNHLMRILRGEELLDIRSVGSSYTLMTFITSLIIGLRRKVTAYGKGGIKGA